MNVVVLCGGPKGVYADPSVRYPKNLSYLGGRTLIEHVIEHLSSLLTLDVTFTFVIRRDENQLFHTGKIINQSITNSRVLEVFGETSGAACTSLLAVNEESGEDSLIIVNGDQIIEGNDLASIVSQFEAKDCDGGTIVFKSLHPRWSFVRCDEQGFVVEAAEKVPISNLATAGFYYFRRSLDFVEAAMSMIRKDASINNTFYVCPVFNELILNQKKILTFEIHKNDYITLSAPADIEAYDRHLDERSHK